MTHGSARFRRKGASQELKQWTDAVAPDLEVSVGGDRALWSPGTGPVAITQSSGRERLNIHGAIDLETGNTRMLDVLVVNAASDHHAVDGD